MPGDVLDVFGLLAVDVARQVEVELVALDLLEGNHARIFLQLQPLVEDVHDLVNIPGAQAVLGTVLHEPAAGVDHEDAFSGLGIPLVDDDDAGGDARAIEQVGGQADDALDVALADQRAADVGFGIAAEEHAMRQDARAFAGALERAHDVQQVGVIALFGRRHAEGFESGRTDRGAGRSPVLQRLSENGGLATTKSKVLSRIAILELGIGERVALP